MNLASTDEKKPLTEAEKEALTEQFFINLRRRYKPEVVWRWSSIHNPRGNGLFGLGFKRQEGGQTQALDFTLGEDDARRLGDILSEYFRLKDAGDPLIYRPDAAQPEMLSGNDSVAVSTADVPVSLSFRQQQAEVLGLQARLKSLRVESPNVAGSTAALLRAESSLLTLQSERILAQ